MPLIFHFFEYTKLTNHSIYFNRGGLCCLPRNSPECNLCGRQFPMQQCLCHSDKGFTISNINIIINFTMGFCKLDLYSWDIVRHIYIKSKLLGLISMI